MPLLIRREKHGTGFKYLLDGKPIADRAEITRIESLAIPPAWRSVLIATSSREKVQATGRDKAGRQQMIYSAAYRNRQEKKKYERITAFAERLPAMRRQIEKDLLRKKLSREKVLACIVKLMDEAYFRVGNGVYTRENQSYGITTLRSKHTTIEGDQVIFEFSGKSGQHQTKKITNRQIARIIRQLDELPGYEIFKYYDENNQLQKVNSTDVNAYIKQHMGSSYTAKDFRTWGGTLQAVAELAVQNVASTEKDRKKSVASCVRKVARKLGNTPSVARSSYIDPRVIRLYLDGKLSEGVEAALERIKSQKHLHPEEACALHLLRSV